MYTVYGKEWCPYCDKVKDELVRSGCNYTYFDIECDPKLRSYLVDTLGLKTVPQVFKGQEHIGGYEDVVNHLHQDFEDLF